jgi:hypothetical protein
VVPSPCPACCATRTPPRSRASAIVLQPRGLDCSPKEMINQLVCRGFLLRQLLFEDKQVALRPHRLYFPFSISPAWACGGRVPIPNQQPGKRCPAGAIINQETGGGTRTGRIRKERFNRSRNQSHPQSASSAPLPLLQLRQPPQARSARRTKSGINLRRGRINLRTL